MLVGKVAFVGVAGRTLTLACGDFVGLWAEMEAAGDVMLAEDVELAFECVW